MTKELAQWDQIASRLFDHCRAAFMHQHETTQTLIASIQNEKQANRSPALEAQVDKCLQTTCDSVASVLYEFERIERESVELLTHIYEVTPMVASHPSNSARSQALAATLESVVAAAAGDSADIVPIFYKQQLILSEGAVVSPVACVQLNDKSLLVADAGTA